MNLAHFKTFILLTPVALALAACQRHDEAQSGAVPGAKPGISVTDGTLTLPVIKGNPGAAYFTVTNRGKSVARIVAIDVDGALKVEMHDSENGMMAPAAEVPVQPGQSVKFSPGAKHAMVFDLDKKLVAGGTTELTLTFDDGDKASTRLKITAGGADAMGEMPAMTQEGHS